MLTRTALLMLGLLLAGSVVAKGDPKPLPACPVETALRRGLLMQGDFDIDPSINTLMLNVIDGKLPQVQRQLSAMPPADAVRWRQSALIIATYARQTDMVEAMLRDGAVVNQLGWMPDLKRSFVEKTKTDIRKDPKWDTTNPDLVTALKEQEVMMLPPGLDGPALYVATQCADVQTMELLLSHHADVDATPAHDSANPLEFAVATGNPTTAKLLLDHGANPDRALLSATALDHAGMVELLLDHGADPCHSNRLIRKPEATLASIGKKQGIPDALLKKLICPANANSH